MATITRNGYEYELCEANGVQYYQDWERSEGGIYMVNAKTINRYHELKAEQPDSEKYGIFFAFNDEQFKQGYDGLVRRGFIKDGDKVERAFAGGYGTRSEIDRYLAFYKEREERTKAECNPQEVYFYEWNNHECMFGGDDEALKIVASIFGNEAAHTIHRVYAGTPANVLAPLTERDKHMGEYEHTLRMLGRLKSDCNGFFSEGDCRYHRPDDLWARNVKGEVDEMRKLYHQLPDDIKDASPLSADTIRYYSDRFTEWAEEEFSKPQYDPEPRTPRSVYKDLEIRLDEQLYYKDDDGKWQHPDTVWFSHDSRRWHQDANAGHGRAYTSYLGKKGTTLAPVYISSSHSLNFVPFVRKDLCDVTCSFDSRPLQYRLYDFYHE